MPKTYKGSCHCGTTRFEVDLELDHVRVCDCSICRCRGALNHRVPEAALRLLTPLDSLSLYQWHTGNAKDYFCPKCGIQSFRRPRSSSADEARALGGVH
ncbi:MAG: GFA family protein, partial [Betaproteobacteria bacterium]|nr:GFA family protein [Betaproteobacteria bacterium]